MRERPSTVSYVACPAQWQAWASMACSAAADFRAIGALHTGDAFQGAPGTCVKFTPDPRISLFTVGPYVAASTFQSMTETLE